MEKTDIKIWLKAIKRDRYWLAEKLLCKKRTIDSWLSSTSVVPNKAARVIACLMSKYPVGNIISNDIHEPGEENSLTLTVDSDTFDQWNSAATGEGKLLRQWAIDVLTEEACETNEGGDCHKKEMEQ